MKINDKPELQQKLAAEYVLGSLKGGARRRFEHWLSQDSQLLQVVRKWEGMLLPMAEFAQPAQPSPQVLTTLQKRLGLAGSQDRWAFWRQLREDLSFWRGLGMFSTTAAVLLVTVLLTQVPEVSPPASLNYVATLSDDKAQPVVVITANKNQRTMTVKLVQEQAIAANQSLELWSIAKDGKVKSLGLISANGSVVLHLPDYLTPELTNILAISLEPKGGSGNPEKPSGPILFKGVWLQV